MGELDRLTFDYRPPTALMVGFVAVSVALGIFGSWGLGGNHRGLLLLGIIRLGPLAATALGWVMVAFCFAFAIIGLKGLLSSAFDCVLAIDPEGISLSRTGLSGKPRRVEFRQVAFVRLKRGAGSEFLEITQYDGDGMDIVSAYLPNKVAFGDVILAVDAGVKKTLM